MGRQSVRYLLLDLPSDHEIEGSLSTECDILYAMLANQELEGVTKHVRVARAETLWQLKQYPYEAEIVHLAGHATEDGLWVLGEVLKWELVAEHLAGCVKPLESGEQRIINFSCCNSEMAVDACASVLRPHFSGIYHFVEPSVEFSKAIATWTMFFYKQPTVGNHREIVSGISTYLGTPVLRYVQWMEGFMRENYPRFLECCRRSSKPTQTSP